MSGLFLSVDCFEKDPEIRKFSEAKLLCNLALIFNDVAVFEAKQFSLLPISFLHKSTEATNVKFLDHLFCSVIFLKMKDRSPEREISIINQLLYGKNNLQKMGNSKKLGMKQIISKRIGNCMMNNEK
ncbi:hypothetical protein LOAG_07184 [Loa loa]|uniref:Uncharacterized protein n=1 Tax=Loa loa TaxID=7209 RepID=A0A1S0TY13_LOALO|nr:hypothetical protein LOAG_07184 [Loa loa]EFO21306.1 hypothetical protein LOAG_07184 [Loa loa]